MPAALLVLVAAFLSFGAGPAAAALSSTPVPVAAANGTVRTVAAGNGQLFLGGTFSRVGTPNRSLAALSTTTGLNASGFPQSNGIVYVIIPDGGGGFYVGGTFTVIGGRARNRLAHLTSSGSVDGFDPNVNNEVRALVLSGTTLYAGGNFTSVNGSTTRNRLAAFDTTQPTANVRPFDPNVSEVVNALVVSGTTLYAGGNFNVVNGTTTRNDVAAFDTTQATANVLPFDPNVNDNVEDLVLSGTTLYVGGIFRGTASVNGTTTRNRVAAFDTTQPTANVLPFDPNLNADVYALLLTGTTLYVGGDFSPPNAVNGNAARTRLAAFDTTKATANVLPFDPNITGRVNVLALSGTTLYVGGEFAGTNSVNGTTTRGALAAFDTTKATGNVLPFNPDSEARVYSLVLSGSTLYAGGNFVFAGSPDDVPRNNLASISATTGAVTTFDPNIGGVVLSLAVSGSTLYVGGTFTGATSVNGNTTRNRLAAFDTTRATANVLPFDPSIGNGAVNALALSGTTLYAGGTFTAVNGGTPRNRVAALDTTQPTANVLPFDPSIGNGAVSALALSGTTLYAGGTFNGAGSVNGTTTRNQLAAFDTTKPTANVLPFDAGSNGDVNALAVSGTTLYAGGLFSAVNGGTTRNRIAAFDTSQAVANVLPFNPNPNGQVNGLALSGTTLYAGGTFVGVNGGLTRNRLAAFDTTRATANVLPFDPDVNGAISALALSGTTLYAGGNFTSAGTTVTQSLASFVDQAPTAVRWRGGAARALTGRRGVRVTWTTGLESDNLGFDVLRIRRGHHTRVRVTRKLILGGTLSRRSYRFTDTTGRRGDRYYVIDRDLRGHATVHPVGAAA